MPGDTQVLALFLDQLMAHSPLIAEEQAAILALPGMLATVPARTDVVPLHLDADHCCYVVSGLVGRFGQTREGARQIIALHIAGEMADLHSAVRQIGVGRLTALCDTTILRIPHAAVRQLAAHYPAVAEAFWRHCVLDAAVLLEWTVSLGRRKAQERVAHLFCEMAVRYGRGGAPLTRYALSITQEQIGDAIGLTAVHVNRMLKQLREQGLVTFTSRSVTIPDWSKLCRAGGFDPAYLVGDTVAKRVELLPKAA